MVSTVLITGANGFIGSYTALLFESLGHRVVPIDITPRSPDLSLLSIATPTHTVDVTDSTAFRELFKRNNITHIFHAAHPRRDEDPEVLNFCLQAMPQCPGGGKGDENKEGDLRKFRGPLRPAQKKRP